ncbi:succinate dehydrogenase cytochrome b subunit [Nocardioides sp.]|uniref:succinate dehydrogenase cytochrome b subunit n=1 Tax=Nocardioides sp. TaxID=35761 RepID=UPI002BFF743F|nr:succinate dehydrogenase cytochrome b subunit [Nocardioides sp.]HVX53700.1 succinate dehydrogenase cytochrome b subunit [Nocardioides sp.]
MATTELVKGVRSTRSTIALKLAMATSGIIFILFVLVHMYGNLKAFSGHDAYDTYAEHLRTIGTPMLPRVGALWVVRVVLILSVITHVWSAAVLWRRANQARTVRYQVKRNLASSISSRTMRWGGLTILLFVIWHLIEFTIGKVNIKGGAKNDPYNLLVDSFSGSSWWMVVIYLLALLALALHLHHGTFSACQTLGWTNTAASRARARIFGWVLAIVIAGGFALVPIFIAAGVITK